MTDLTSRIALRDGQPVLIGGSDVVLEPVALLPGGAGRSFNEAWLQERLRREIEITERRGWADAPEEMYSGVNAIGAPIFSADGTLAGTLAIVGAVHFLATPLPHETVHALLKAARRISQALGHDPTVRAPGLVSETWSSPSHGSEPH